MHLLAIVLTQGQAHAQAVLDVPTTYPTVQAAVNASSNGDIVRIHSGPIFETVTVGNRTLTIDTPYDTPTQVQWVVTGGSALGVGPTGNLTVEDINFVGGTTIESLVEGEGSVCVYPVFTPADTHAITSLGGDVTVRNTEFRCITSANTPPPEDDHGKGAGIYMNTSSGSSLLTIEDSLFWGNVVEASGAHVFARGDVEIRDSGFWQGQALRSGGGVFIEGTAGTDHVIIQDSNFRFNFSAERGGGIAIQPDGDNLVDLVDLNHLYIQENSSLPFFDPTQGLDTSDTSFRALFYLGLGKGGAAFIEAVDLDMWANAFCGNFADEGGGIYLRDIDAPVIENNLFVQNWSAHYGGGLYVRYEPDTDPDGDPEYADPTVYPRIYNNHFVGGNAGYFPPPFIELIANGSGGGLTLNGTLANFHNNVIARNWRGGGMLGDEGVNWVIGDPIDVEYNTFHHNCDQGTCDEIDPGDWLNFSGEFATLALSPTNILTNPEIAYFGPDQDWDCFPDAFYTDWSAPVVNSGDPLITDVGGSRSDMGAFGGPRADVLDRDEDGYENIYDCDDTDPLIHPDAAELCDITDNDCDGFVDEGFINTWWPDADGDGYGEGLPLIQCAPPIGFVAEGGDCDGANPAVNPGAAEVCNTVDDDCNGVVDDDDILVYELYFLDSDGDGFGQPSTVTACELPTGYTRLPGDCDDTNAAINPSAEEFCDGVDNNCDNEVDNADAGTILWYPDADGDGFGTEATGAVAGCEPPEPTGWVADGGDCDDADPTLSPGMDETCNGIDDDCDGVIDDDPVDADVWYVDADGDGQGDDASAEGFCEGDEPGDGWVTKGGDCDDTDELNACEPCGCQSTPSAPTGILGLLLTVFALRRRREG